MCQPPECSAYRRGSLLLACLGFNVEASVQHNFKSLVHNDLAYPRQHGSFILGNKLKQQQKQTTAKTEVGQVVQACTLSYLTGWGRGILRPAWSRQWVPGQPGNFVRLSQNKSRRQAEDMSTCLECVRSWVQAPVPHQKSTTEQGAFIKS